ncbi:MAG: pantoate--beta-alanine ligase [Candidatus Omnitrophica bacterium]|nr:pantoate--beta-alanine ligase [Candidatus Omnitrophota bacterium]
MKVIRTIRKMQGYSRRMQLKGRTIGFVPTMGALHEGHLSLIRKAKTENNCAVASIFVNPAQFGPKEDLHRYPRDFRRDASLLRREGVDALFYPQAKEMYPQGYCTFVEVEGLSRVLCGRSRPGHFRGVATVVTKLFNIVNPTRAYFGQKDAQQAAIIRRLAKDLNMPVRIKVSPIVREPAGLALSSRNVYLSKEGRRDALVLSEALRLAEGLVRKGVRDSGKIIRKMTQLVRAKKRVKIDYIFIVNLADLKPIGRIKGKALIAMAARIGSTRLIDNVIVR